ncbi:MAG TPA: 2-oxo acid dehydrogenase subunit E2 [Solirubrobacteraceae bacterium]
MSETAKGSTEISEPSRAQQQLARRVAESRATVPDLTLATDVDLEAALALGAPARALVVRATAVALREQPHVNAAYRDGRFERYSRVNVAVAIDTPAGVVAPTIADADTKGLATIAEELAQLEAAAEQLAAPATAGATSTVHSAAGVRRIVPLLTPPQAVAIGAGDVQTRAVVRDGAVVAAPAIELTLVCDHRIIYGAIAAAFLARVRELLETTDAL